MNSLQGITLTTTDKIATFSLGTALGLIGLLRNGPHNLREPLLRLLKIYSQPDLAVFVRKLVWVAGIAGVLKTNRFLNHLARNNWSFPSNETWNWPEEVAVVTGGSGGIGGQIVKGLAEKGVQVAVVDLVEPKQFDECRFIRSIIYVFMTWAHIFSLDKNVHFFKCDITDKENVDAIATEITSKLGAPSILVNNAGIAHAHTMLESTPDYLRKLYDINVLSHFYTLQAFLPSMITAKKGHIISTCSISSFFVPAGLVDYAATKAAVMAMHEGLNQELKYRYNAPMIRTTVVHPTYVRTPLTGSWEKALVKSSALTMSPEYVGGEIVKAILSGRSQQVILPRTFAFTSTLRAMPWWVQEILRSRTKDDMKRL